MDFNKLKEIAKGKGIKVGFRTKGLYKLIAPMIPDTETVIEMASGFDKNSANSCPIIVTDKNVYFFNFSTWLLGGLDQRIIPLKNVTSLSSGGGLLASFVINDGTAEYEVKGIVPKKANDLIQAINEQKAKRIESSVTPAPSPTTELRELKSLLDDGIITEEDFNNKKEELLGL